MLSKYFLKFDTSLKLIYIPELLLEGLLCAFLILHLQKLDDPISALDSNSENLQSIKYVYNKTLHLIVKKISADTNYI